MWWKEGVESCRLSPALHIHATVHTHACVTGGLTRRAQLMRSSSLVTTYSARLLGRWEGLGTTAAAPALDTADCVLRAEQVGTGTVSQVSPVFLSWTYGEGQTESQDRTTSSLRPTRPTLGLINRERRSSHTREVSQGRTLGWSAQQCRLKALDNSTQTLLGAKITCWGLQWPHSDGLCAAGPLCLSWGCKRGILRGCQDPISSSFSPPPPCPALWSPCPHTVSCSSPGCPALSRDNAATVLGETQMQAEPLCF